MIQFSHLTLKPAPRKFMVLVLCLILAIQPARGQLAVSDNGRYLVNSDGTPFLWLGDTGWGLFEKLTREDVDFYLQKRAEQGFSVIHAAAVHKNPFIVPELQNIYGDKAFIDEPSMKPLITEGASPADDLAYDYWDHVDHVVDRAAEYGLKLVFLPLFGMAEGEGYNLINPGNACEYGKFLGSRYKNKTNLIWCIGGDVLADNDLRKQIWSLLAKGITEGATGGENYAKTLMTFHVRGGHSSSDYFTDVPWLDVHMIQTWDSYTRIYPMVSSDYRNETTRPVLHGEGAYEDGPEYPTKPITPHKIRKQAYWATFAGGMHTYGNSNVWNFGTNSKYVTSDWKEALVSDGAKCMSLYHSFFQTLRWWEFVPDGDVILEGASAADSLNVAMSSAATGQILIYISEPSTLTLDLQKLGNSGESSGEWIDPRTGKRKKARAFHHGRKAEVSTPVGWEDALLLISAKN